MFSSEYCEIFKNTSFYRTPPAAVFGYFLKILGKCPERFNRKFHLCKGIPSLNLNLQQKLRLFWKSAETQRNSSPDLVPLLQFKKREKHPWRSQLVPNRAKFSFVRSLKVREKTFWPSRTSNYNWKVYKKKTVFFT